MQDNSLSDYTPYLNWIDGQYDRMVNALIVLADINSGTFNIQGLDSVCKKLMALLKPLNGKQEIVSLAPVEHVNIRGEKENIQVGRAIHIRKRPEAPSKVFLCIHMDTVFPKDSHFQKTSLLRKNKLRGPGVADAKGGLLVMITALEALERSPWAKNIGWEILINSDEEIGSPGSAHLMAQCAKNNHLGLIYEPSLSDGSMAAERKGSGNFIAVVRGRSVHAGREHHQGRNAIRAMADFINAIDDLNGLRQGVTVNPGFVHGGGPVNIVPDLSILKFNIRIAKPNDEAWVNKQLENALSVINDRDGFHMELHGQFNRKPKIISKENHSLMQEITRCGADLGMKIKWQATGGACDGNNLAVAGLPNVDNLGVRGGKTHTDEEFIHLESLTERAKLSALFLMKLAKGQIKALLKV